MRDRADLADGTIRGVGDSHNVPVMDDLRMIEAFLAGPRDLERDIRAGLEPGQPVGQVMGPERLPQQVLPALGVLGAGEHRLRGEPRVIEGVLDSRDRRQGPGLMRQHGGGLDEPAVPGGDHDAVTAARDTRTNVHRRLLPPLDQELGDDGHEVLDRLDPGKHRGADPLTKAALIPHEQGGEDAGGRLQPCAEAPPVHREEDGTIPVTVPAPCEQPGLGAHQGVVALEPGVRPAGAESGDGAVDQPGVGRAEGVGVHSPRPGGAGREPLDDHVGVPGQLAQRVLASRGPQVRDKTLLAAVPDKEAARHRRAQPVPLRRLELDDPGPGVGQDHAGDRRRYAAGAHLDDVQAGADSAHSSLPRVWKQRVSAIDYLKR